MSSEATLPAAPALTFREALIRFKDWFVRHPVSGLLLAALLGTLVYFYGFYHPFMNGTESTMFWAKRSWNSENDLEHGILIIPIALYIVWHHRAALAAATKSPHWLGLVIAFIGVAMFVVSVRTLQPRLALMSMPPLAFGAVFYLWGWRTARLVAFPCAFLLFMVPLGFLVSRTVGLQNLAANVAAQLSGLIGIGVHADGASLIAHDGLFKYEVAGGCSGIRSLTAMIMLAALYVHFTQKELWKKATIFASSIVFALIGNLMRVFSVILVAKFINPELAGNLYHDYSGFIFFPIAVIAMVAFSNLLNKDWGAVWKRLMTPETAPAGAGAGAAAQRHGGKSGPISYDY